MRIIVAVCVYNRYENIEKWISCWQQANTGSTELVIIHNFYNNESEKEKFKKLCTDIKVRYVPRNGNGFDIGALQDVFKERLGYFPNDWDYLLWCADDTFPMSKDFIQPFIEKIQQPGVGIACMQLSNSVSPHFRTSGFCISKETSLKIKFNIDPIKTKQDCYFFEHRGGNKTFTNQIRQMGLSCVQVAPIKTSPLWDSDHPNLNKRIYREQEFKQIWGLQTDKVVFIVPIYDAFPQIISSLICQTYKNWELLLLHDGSNDLTALLKGYADERVKYINRPRAAPYGHQNRQWALQEIKEGRLGKDADYIVISNGDNYHTPTFIEDLLCGFVNGTVAAYCSEMVHSYIHWGVIPASLKRGYIDCGQVMVKKDIACDIGWRDTDSHSSDFTYFEDIIKKHGADKFIKVKGCTFVHN